MLDKQNARACTHPHKWVIFIAFPRLQIFANCVSVCYVVRTLLDLLLMMLQRWRVSVSVCRYTVVRKLHIIGPVITISVAILVWCSSPVGDSPEAIDVCIAVGVCPEIVQASDRTKVSAACWSSPAVLPVGQFTWLVRELCITKRSPYSSAMTPTFEPRWFTDWTRELLWYVFISPTWAR